MPGKRQAHLHPAASAELVEAIEEYEDQREGRGAAFDAAVDRAIETIVNAPERWPLSRHVPPRLLVRAYMLKRFPYDIVYRLRGDDELEVIAMAHHKRKPGYWKRR